MNSFRIFENDDGLKILERKGHIEELLLQFESEIYEKWKMSVSSIIPECMTKNLLQRSEDKLLILNFDDKVS